MSPAKRTNAAASRSTKKSAIAAKKASAKKSSAKKSSAKKAATKKAATKKAATKKASKKKASTQKAAKKKPAAKKRAVKKKSASAKAATAEKKAKTTASVKKAASRNARAKTNEEPKSTPTGATKSSSKATEKTSKPTRKKAVAKRPAQGASPRAADAGRAAEAQQPKPTPEAPPRETRATAGARKAKERTKSPSVEQQTDQATELPIQERPTEELWTLYRGCADRRRKKSTEANKVELELLRNVLMERHYPLVKYIAERLLQTLPKSIELDDLISAGQFGLMDAIKGFDPDRGIKFKTYCTTRIRGSILDQLRSQDWVPRLVRLKASKIEKALQRLTGEYGREPTHAELAEELELDHGELSKEMTGAHAKSMYSLSDKWEDRDDDSSMEKVDVLEDKRAIDPIGELNRHDMMLFITRSLTHKERFIIEQYYQVGHTMREIGEMLALTESRVCQIHSNVMGRLKSLFGTKQTAMLM